MLHIGHFSFDERDADQNDRHGYFTCLIDVDKPENAVARFAAYILEMKKENPCLENLVKVYIEDIIKIETIPEDPIMTHLQSSEGAFPRSVSYSLPSVFKDGIEAYGSPSNVRKHENDESGRYLFSNPIITFE